MDNKLTFQGKEFKLKRITLAVQNNTVELFEKLQNIEEPETVQSVHDAIQELRKTYAEKCKDIDSDLSMPVSMKDYFKQTEGNNLIKAEQKIKDTYKKENATPELFKQLCIELLENGNEIDFSQDVFEPAEFSSFMLNVLMEYKKKEISLMS